MVTPTSPNWRAAARASSTPGGNPRTVSGLVAIKVLPARPSGGREARFDRELELLARLSHRNVVGIVDSGSAGDGRPFLVMELVDGPTIDRCDAVTAWAQDPADAVARDRLVELVAQVCDGVASAHRRGIIVHRDLKPSNVRIDHDGTPKVLDFGLAKDLGGPLDDLTRGGASAGAVFLGTCWSGAVPSRRAAKSTTSIRAPTCGGSA